MLQPKGFPQHLFEVAVFNSHLYRRLTAITKLFQYILSQQRSFASLAKLKMQATKQVRSYHVSSSSYYHLSA
jgi:hypothetical protein